MSPFSTPVAVSLAWILVDWSSVLSSVGLLLLVLWIVFLVVLWIVEVPWVWQIKSIDFLVSELSTLVASAFELSRVKISLL